MSHYTGLLLKDWKLSIKGQLQNYLLILALWLLGVGVALRMDEPEVAIAVGLTLISIHIFYMGTDVIMNLVKEQKLKIWLYNPNPARSLLSSKLVISLFNCLFSTTFAIVLYAISCFASGQPFLQGKDFSEALALIGTIIGVGMYFAIWATFFWSQYAAAKGKRFEYVRIAFSGFIAYFIFQIHEGFMLSSLYDRLKDVGSFPSVSLGTLVTNETKDGYQEISMGVSLSEFSFALFAVFLAISVFVFFLSVKNVKKIEV
ncbi:hypothetical protein AB685_10340 [Bacillus sp. LL01]|uniref:hypothetical protein n=1 Tax=Bacillus sp. LL01 TaxID=1665556 RepID=UPI00064D5B35|nr:hypothetical protein [Bacillus sp. LL01]KMJ58299.1 hypothetical protein AB685_10340 [Bacillus sp. LL01]